MNLYRRHADKCTKGYDEYDRSGDKCNCPIWIEWQLGKDYLKKSTKTASMTRARKLVVMAEERGYWEQSPIPLSEDRIQSSDSHLVPVAIAQFLDDARDPNGKNLSPPTISKYETILGRLEAFCKERRLFSIEDLNHSHLMAFKRGWSTGPQSTANNIARLRSFWKYCLRHDWCKKNIAKDLEMPLNYQFTERQPFTETEIRKILKAANTVKLNHQQEATNEEIECMILLMRYGGLGISDAALFQESELVGDEARYYRKKLRRRANRQLVVVPLPKSLCRRILELPRLNGGYFFCHGSNEVGAATDVWHKRLGFVFEEAGIINGSGHKFRHAFATSLLVAGQPIEDVSRWLGHSSIKTTERYYSHWLRERIDRSSSKLREHYAGL